MKKITVIVSGSGSNLQAIIDACESGKIKDAKVTKVISNNKEAYALERAKKAGIPTFVIAASEPQSLINSPLEIAGQARNDKKYHSGDGQASGDGHRQVPVPLTGDNPDLIVLAGYMKVIPPETIKEITKAGIPIINIHPSLIPKHCGKGYYGIKVHESVIAAGDKESGATVHYVDEGVDSGEIIIQKKVPVLEADTPEQLAARVLETEHEIIVEAVNKVLNPSPNVTPLRESLPRT
jgi:phosphoribosylglycinamide formyltransferase-1